MLEDISIEYATSARLILFPFNLFLVGHFLPRTRKSLVKIFYRYIHHSFQKGISLTFFTLLQSLIINVQYGGFGSVSHHQNRFEVVTHTYSGFGDLSYNCKFTAIKLNPNHVGNTGSTILTKKCFAISRNLCTTGHDGTSI